MRRILLGEYRFQAVWGDSGQAQAPAVRKAAVGRHLESEGWLSAEVSGRRRRGLLVGEGSDGAIRKPDAARYVGCSAA